jgi:hypothetical protein
MLRRIAFVLSTAVASLALFATGASAEGCPNEQVRRQQSSTALPDCRAYEQVSPAAKFGYSVGDNFAGAVQLGSDAGGDRVSYWGLNPLPGAQAGSFAGLLGERSAGGWTTSSILPPPGPEQTSLSQLCRDADLRGSTSDLLTSVYWDSTTEPWGSLNLVRPDGTRQHIADAPGLAIGSCNGDAPGQEWFEGISEDGHHVLFGSTTALVPGVTETGNDILYEWVDDHANGGAGTLRVVNRTNDPALTLLDSGPASLGGSGSWDRNDFLTGPHGLQHAISTDGSRIFFQNPAPNIVGSSGLPLGSSSLYARVKGTTTIAISDPQPGHSPAERVQYLDATPDGATVFFWANGQLTDEAPVAGGIYRYDMDSGQLRFLTTAPESGAGVPPTAIASSDGSHLYYQNGPDVYVNVEGHDRLILAAATVEGGPGAAGGIVLSNPGLRDDRCPSANVSPTGRYFAFMAFLSDGSTQIYRYDADTGVLDHVSTGPAAPSVPYASTFVSACGGSEPRPLLTRVMSDDGQYVFFDTAAPLVPQDNNGAFDTYEWHNGVVTLLGSGTNTDGSSFMGTDSSGANAFLETDQPLASQDGDQVADVYDARIGGGFPVAPDHPACAGDLCQGPPTAPPDLAVTGSLTFSGQGNAPPVTAPVRLKVSRLKAVTGTSALLHVTLPAGGTLITSGAGVRSTSRRLSTAGAVSITVSLTSRARATLKRKHLLKVNLQVVFRPTAGASSTAQLSLTFKATSKQKGHS